MKKIFLIFFLSIFLSACTNNEAVIPYVEVRKVSLDNYNKIKVFYGYIDKGDKVNLSFSISGLLDKILVSEGQFVKKGTLLVQINNEEYSLNLKKRKLELNEATIKYNRAKNYFDRISKLYEAGGISHNDWENAQTELLVTQNNIEILKDSIQIAKEKLRFAKIVAPYDGQIIKVFKDDFQFVNSGDAIFSFQGVGDFLVRVFVSQNDIDKINVGDFVDIFSDVEGKKLKGVVKSKVESSLNSGSFRITISIISPDKILTGETVKVYFNSLINNLITVPINSVFDVDGKKIVYFVAPIEKNFGRVYSKEVLTGEIINNEIEILSGVLPDDILIVDGVNKIMNNSIVRFNN